MVLLDTHALLWWLSGGTRLSARAAREIARADRVLVSPISCWEVAVLVRRGRVALDREVTTWVRDIAHADGVEIAPLTPTAAAAAGLLQSGDPADGFLLATARERGVPLVSKDAGVRALAGAIGVRVIW